MLGFVQPGLHIFAQRTVSKRAKSSFPLADVSRYCHHQPTVRGTTTDKICHVSKNVGFPQDQQSNPFEKQKAWTETATSFTIAMEHHRPNLHPVHHKRTAAQRLVSLIQTSPSRAHTGTQKKGSTQVQLAVGGLTAPMQRHYSTWCTADLYLNLVLLLLISLPLFMSLLPLLSSRAVTSSSGS